MSRAPILLALVVALGSTLAFGPSAQAQEAPAAPVENAFARGEFQVDASSVRIALEARGDVGEPRVRTESGFVRLWFPGMTGWMSLDLDADGNAVRFVRVRPGADDTGVVVIRVGDGRRVGEASVGVARAANRVVITLPRAALPPVFEALPPSAPVEVAPAAAASTPAPAPEPDAEGAAAEAVAAEPEAQAASSSLEPRTAAEALAGPPPSAPRDETPLTLGVPAPATSSLATLLGITVLLALALGAVQWFRSRRAPGTTAPSIRIVASARLSPRQQLVVVRALGQDHLIALEPGHTERLLSIPTAEAPREEEHVPELRLSSAKLAAGAAAPASFGAELLRLVESVPPRAHAPTMAAANPPPLPTSSEAVAGIARLRAAAR